MSVVTAQELSYRTIHAGHTVGAQISLAADPAGGVVFTDTAAHMVGRMDSQGNVVYIAGSPGTPGSMDGPAVNATFNSPHGVAVDSAGNIFVADSSNNKIRKIAPDGWVSTLAGTNVCGSSDGFGAAAGFCFPLGVAIGPDGSILVGDAGNSRIRLVSATGIVTTIAGSSYGFADGSGSAAKFSYPASLAFDGADAIYVADKYNQVIRRVTLSGSVTTIAGSPGSAGDSDGTGSQARFNTPTAIAIRPDGVLVVADTSNHGVKSVTPAGLVTAIAGFRGSQSLEGIGLYAGFLYPEGIAAAGVEELYVSDRAGTTKLGSHAIADRATIDTSSGFLNVQRQLDVAPSSATRWEWSIVLRPAGSIAQLSDSAIRNPLFIPDAEGQYSFKLYAENPGVGSSVSFVNLYVTCANVPATPQISRISGSSPSCPGEQIVLEASSGYDSYLWSTGETTRTITVAPTSDRYFDVNGFVNGCKSSRGSITQQVGNPIQKLSISLASGSAVACMSGRDTIGGEFRSSQGSTWEPISAYQWSYRTVPGGPSTPIAGATMWNYNLNGPDFPAPGRYYLVVTATPLCAGDPQFTSAEYMVDVYAPPVLTLSANSTVVCGSTPVTLTGTANGPAPSYSVAWMRNGVVVRWDSGRSFTYTTTLPGVYKLWHVTVSTGCDLFSDELAVTTKAAPTPFIEVQGSSSFCPGGSARIAVTNPRATSTYLWSNGMTGTSIVVTEGDWYRVNETDETGCSGYSSSRQITALAAPAVPTITPSGSLSFCEGGSVTLTSDPATSYLWSNGATTQSITVSAAGSHSVTVKNAGGCQATSSPAMVVVNARPVASVTTNGPTSFCEGGSVLLTASAGASYLWSNGATTQSISVAQAGSYSVAVTNEAGCSTTSPATAVTVNPLPTVAITPSGATTFCEGGSVVLTASAGASYLWSNGATTQSITTAQSGTYSVTVTNASGCSTTSAPMAVTVNPLPVAAITANGPTTFCDGGSVVLTATPGASYAWSNGATTPSITVTQSGNYTVTVTTENGCPATSSATAVTVNPLPAATITPLSATTFCEGSLVVLSASSGASYLWSNGATTSTITVTQSGDYSVTVTSFSGCTSTSGPTSVSVLPAPVPTITSAGPTTFCEGGSVTLTASEGASYLWSNGATTQSIVASASGSYSVRVSYVGGCQKWSAATSVTANPTPVATISASGPTSFCIGGSVSLTASPGASYLWSTGETTRSITVAAEGSYSVTVTADNGCSKTSAGMGVYVSGGPVVSHSGTAVLCAGGTGYTATVSSYGAGATYFWTLTNATITSGQGTNTIAFTPTATSGFVTFHVDLANPEGCARPIEWQKPISSPTATITASGPTAFCSGDSVTLTANPGAAYWWSNGATTQSIVVTTSGSYTVSVRNADGCSIVSEPTVVAVDSIPTVTANGPTTFCEEGSVVLTASEGVAYLWSNGATTQSITVSQAGNYSVVVTNARGCATSSAHTAVVVAPFPEATITPSGPTTFCDGQSVVLTASPGSSYLWSNGAISRSITAYDSGTFSVTVANGAGCSTTSAPITVTKSPAQLATVSGGGAICAGGSTTVTATLFGTAPWTITWSDGLVQSGITSSPVIRTVSPSTTTNYSVTAISDANCSGTAGSAAYVSVFPAPTATVSGGATICNGQSAVVTVALTGSGPWTLTWSDGLVQTGISTVNWTRTISPSVTTTYSVTAVSGAVSCVGSTSGSATITVAQKPTISTQPTSKTIRKNTATTLTVGATGTGTLIYQWYRGASGVTTTPVGTNSPNYTTPKLLATTSYWVRVTNACGSTNSATATVTVR